MSDIEQIYVYENWRNDLPTKMGTLYVDGGKGKQVVSFEYDEEWLNSVSDYFIFDPDLRLFKGRQYTPTDKSMFGIFADSCPEFFIGCI